MRNNRKQFEPEELFFIAEDTAETRSLVERVQRWSRVENRAAARRWTPSPTYGRPGFRSAATGEDWVIDAHASDGGGGGGPVCARDGRAATSTTRAPCGSGCPGWPRRFSPVRSIYGCSRPSSIARISSPMPGARRCRQGVVRQGAALAVADPAGSPGTSTPSSPAPTPMRCGAVATGRPTGTSGSDWATTGSPRFTATYGTHRWAGHRQAADRTGGNGVRPGSAHHRSAAGRRAGRSRRGR